MRLCHLNDVPDGASRGFDPRGAGPHHGTSMPWRRHAYLNAAGDRIVCSAHGALFEIDTGRCTLGSCLGQALTPVPVVVNGGEVYLAESARLEGKPS